MVFGATCVVVVASLIGAVRSLGVSENAPRLLAAEYQQSSAAGKLDDVTRGGAAQTERTGCALSQHLVMGEIIDGTLLWEEDGLPSVNRSYGLYVPPSYKPGKPTGIVFVFHGWGDPSTEENQGLGKWPLPYHRYYGYGRAADQSGFITVYPRGLADCQKGADCFQHSQGYESWNGVGTTGSTKHGITACDLTIQHGNYCYESTGIRKGKCHRCDWTTGYNDVAFVRALLAQLASALGIDPNRVFATGCSNGGMFVHELAQKMSDKIAAVAANCAGKPHLNFHHMPEGPPVSIMLVTGVYDQTIRGFNESEGEEWWDGFKFASRLQVFAAYRDHNKCPESTLKVHYQTMKGVHAPGSKDPDRREEREGANDHLEQRLPVADYDRHAIDCYEMYSGCAGNTSIVSCEWQGGHDIMKGEPEFAYNFFAQHPRLGSQSPGMQ